MPITERVETRLRVALGDPIEEIFFGTVTFTEVNHSTGVIGEVKEEEDTGGSIS